MMGSNDFFFFFGCRRAVVYEITGGQTADAAAISSNGERQIFNIKMELLDHSNYFQMFWFVLKKKGNILYKYKIFLHAAANKSIL